jgi:aerotaxis receptor
MSKSNHIIVPDGVYIVSETDERGIIKEINHAFTEISGYAREDVIDKPHNILRHEDMPKAAFKELWDTIKSGRTWRGFVKNRAKNGDYYWVYATVTKIDRADGFKGFTSIRQKMSANEIKKYEEIYKKMKESE